MLYRITLLPQQQNIKAAPGQTLWEALRKAGCVINASCGGTGTCGKCKVLVDGKEMLACRTVVDRDMTVVLPEALQPVILTDGIRTELAAGSGVCLAVDLGTTTVAAYLMEGGRVLAVESSKNPQAAFGTDVVSRISCAIKGEQEALTEAIRKCVKNLTNTLLGQTGKFQLERVCIVGNPAMQQLFLGLPVENLAKPPFSPLLTKTKLIDGGQYVPLWKGAQLQIVPNISGYIGADTVAGILATGMDRAEKVALLVDIGTNGEMVLGNKDRLIACATAAGPALEGAGIRFGMQAAKGAIDHVTQDLSCHVIGEEEAVGICGSGLLDAVAAALDQGLINQRGRILNDEHCLPLTDSIYLTQEDIRQLQQAKGAIAAGISLLAEELQIRLQDIETVYLAGGFGTFLDGRSACRVGLLPAELEDKILSVGNVAGSGAKQMVCDRTVFSHADVIVSRVEHLELATLPEWAKRFSQCMYFDSQQTYWCKKALSMGFSEAVPMETAKLVAREDVRSMCAADKCGAYAKNWTCPPHCGTPAECEAQMRSFPRGILVQTVGATQKLIDSKAYRETEKRHLQQFHALAAAIRTLHPKALCLGSGGCRVCKTCAFPDPCRFPEKACSSMEAYGLFVTDVCRENGLAYHHGEKTVTYTACIMF